jgi:hypothetical protein
MSRPFEIEKGLRQLLDPHPTPDAFKSALIGLSRQSREEVVRLWLTKGIPFAFRSRPAVYENLRTWLGTRLDVGPKEITMVGSARIGFSMAGPTAFGRLFDENSDLDLCVVSRPQFEELAETFSRWRKDYLGDAVRPRSLRDKYHWDQNLVFGKRNLPLGFFDADKIPTLNRYPVVQRIQNSMWALKQKLLVTPDAPRPPRVSTRVYRSWEDLINRVSLNLYWSLTK